MKGKFQTILLFIVFVALTIRAIGSYDMFYGIALFSKWMAQDYGRAITRIDLIYYSPSILLICATVAYAWRFRKNEKLYKSNFFNVLMAVTFPDLFFSFFVFSMSGPLPLS